MERYDRAHPGEILRKTKLMQVANSQEPDDIYANTRLIDHTVYMLCDAAEGAFGSDWIEAIQGEILYTQTGMNRQPVLEFLVNSFIHDHLLRTLAQAQHTVLSKDLGKLKPLNEETQADYFMAFIQIEKDTRNTPMEKSANELQKMLFGYTSVTPFAVCQSLVDFFKYSKDQYGLYLLTKKLCRFIKLKASEED